MKVILPVTALCGAFALPVGCMSARDGEVAAPVVTVAPDDFVLRDVRKDAGRRLGCQAPMVDIQVGPWAGSEGNVTAVGCGYRITYYLRCQTNHQCSISVSE